jgi:hypothetical protein
VTPVLLRRRTAAWLALAAMALNAAWPLLANAQPADPALEICSAASGSHAGGGAPATPGKGYHASHCNLCPFGAERAAAIAAVTGTSLLPVAAPEQVFARCEAPQVSISLYPAAPPRGPPFPS